MNSIAVDYEYTFHDLFKLFGFNAGEDHLISFDMSPEDWLHDFATICESTFAGEEYVEEAYLNDGTFEKLLFVGILAPHYESIVGSITRFYPYYITEEEMDANEPGGEEISEKVAIPFLQSLFQIYAQTKDKYQAMLDTLAQLEDETGGLLKRPSSSSTNLMKYSDTPQDTTSEATLLDDAHLTNVTRNESEVASDGASPIARFAEIAEKYRHILMDWGHEFDQIFRHNRGSR